MRTFIAIALPKEITDNLALIQENLKLSGADVKWVEPKNIHLTLKFLGEIDDKTLGKISKILEEIAQNKTHFFAQIDSIGAFPSVQSPRVIWTGIKKGEKELIELAAILEKKLKNIGIPKEKKGFSSHITLGRLKSNLNIQKLIQSLANFKFDSGIPEFPVSKITLFKSTLTPKGPIYEVIKEPDLKSV